jgi:hypothetical protein
MNYSNNLKAIFNSTLTVLVTSALISLSVWMIKGNFIAAFILAASIQYILFTFIGFLVNNYFIQQTRQKELDKLEQLSTILECTACKKHNIITFIPDENERVEFICDSCSKKNIVSINFTVAGVTDPIILNPTVPAPNQSLPPRQ